MSKRVGKNILKPSPGYDDGAHSETSSLNQQAGKAKSSKKKDRPSVDAEKTRDTILSGEKKTSRQKRGSMRTIKRQGSAVFERGRTRQRPTSSTSSDTSNQSNDIYARMQSAENSSGESRSSFHILPKLAAPNKDAPPSEESSSEAVTPISPPWSSRADGAKKKSERDEDLIFGPLSFDEPKSNRQKATLGKKSSFLVPLHERFYPLYPMPLKREAAIFDGVWDPFAGIRAEKKTAAFDSVESIRGKATPAWLISEIVSDIRQELYGHTQDVVGFEAPKSRDNSRDKVKDSVDMTRDFIEYDRLFNQIPNTISSLSLRAKDRSYAAMSFVEGDTDPNAVRPFLGAQAPTTNPVHRLNFVGHSQTPAQMADKPIVFKFTHKSTITTEVDEG